MPDGHHFLEDSKTLRSWTFIAFRVGFTMYNLSPLEFIANCEGSMPPGICFCRGRIRPEATAFSFLLSSHDKIVSVDKEVARKSWLSGLIVRMREPYLGF